MTERVEESPGRDGPLAGKVAVVTGAAAGLGRAEALGLAAAGADVVVNDVSPAAGEVVDEIVALGAKAVLVRGDVGDSAVAMEILTAAVETLGGLDVVVNNAGVLRDRMLFGMSDDDWDVVMRVHLRGHFLLSRGAAAYWRDRSKERGGPVYGRLVNTASEAWLFGSPGQANYAAAKGGIAALTISAARGLARYGVRANVICPRARTQMTAAVFGEAPEGAVDPLSVDQVVPLVTFLASPASDAVNGQVFIVHSGTVALLAPPTVERRFDAAGSIWRADELAETVGAYFSDRAPDAMFICSDAMSLG